MVNWDYARTQAHDASGIQYPTLWLWEKFQGVFKPFKKIEGVYFECTIRFPESAPEEGMIIKESHDVTEEEDDNIFFYGLSEEEIKEAIYSESLVNEEFYILEYAKVKMA